MTASTLVLRIALLLGASLLVSVLRRRVGGGIARSLVMLAGSVGGLAIGAVAAYPASRAIQVANVDIVSVSLIAGIVFGWALAWQVAKRFPAKR